MRSLKQRISGNPLKAILTAALVIVFAPAFVPAHAKMLKSDPAEGEVLRVSPVAIELDFNTPLQNAGGMNSIVVTDANGKRVDKETVTLAADGKKMRVDLESLASGAYSVEWRALSADDHSIKGRFGFKVMLADAAAPLPENSPAAKSTTDDHAGMDHGTHTPDESGGTGWQSFVRWLIYLAMMMLFGGFAFWLLVLKPALAKIENLPAAEYAQAAGQAGQRLLKLAWVNVVLMGGAVFASLILQTSAVFNLAPAQAVDFSRWRQILTETAFGLPWLMQVVLLSVLSVILFLFTRQSKKDDSGGGNSFLWPVGLGICALLFLMPGLSGHARAAFNEYSLAILLDWLHLLAAGFWIGGLFHLALTMPKAAAALEPANRIELQSHAVSNFTRFVVPAVIVVSLTGIYNSWIHLDDPADLWTTGYGMVLLLKTGLFLVLLAIGGLNSFVLRPRLADSGGLKERNFYRAVRSEALIAVIVLLLAAILAFLPPSRRHEKPTGANDIPARRGAADELLTEKI